MLTDKEKARLEFARQSEDARPYDRIHMSAKIDSTAIIGLRGFGYARDEDSRLVIINHSGNVVIECDVEIRALVTIDRAVKGSTTIGQGTKIDHHCHIAHNVTIGVWNTLAAHTIIEGSCVVGDGNTFGTGVIVQRKVTIGNNNLFGSGCVVTKNCLDNGVYVGNPARLIRYR